MHCLSFGNHKGHIDIWGIYALLNDINWCPIELSMFCNIILVDV